MHRLNIGPSQDAWLSKARKLVIESALCLLGPGTLGDHAAQRVLRGVCVFKLALA